MGDVSPFGDLTASRDALAVARTAMAVLGLSDGELCSAAALAPATLAAWRDTGSGPALAEAPGLWLLAQAVEDLAEMIGEPLAGWLASRPDWRVLLLVEGPERLLDAYDASRPTAWSEPPAWAALYAVGGDRLDSDLEPRTRRLGPRRARVVKAAQPGTRRHAGP